GGVVGSDGEEGGDHAGRGAGALRGAGAGRADGRAARIRGAGGVPRLGAGELHHRAGDGGGWGVDQGAALIHPPGDAGAGYFAAGALNTILNGACPWSWTTVGPRAPP